MKVYGRLTSLIVVTSALLAGCGVSNPPKPSTGHLATPAAPEQPAADQAPIPQVSQSALLPQPEAVPRNAETYTVVVNRVDVLDLLFALARDADMNIDIAGAIQGQVTLNAIDQTLLQILERISLQVALRYELKGDHLLIAADVPYLRTYRVDYLNIERSSVSRVDLATEIGTVGATDADQSSGNNSSTTVENRSRNEFWNSMVLNVAAIIGIEDLSEKDDNVEGTSSIIVNRETGYLTVRATDRQHAEIQRYIDLVTASARRQVLIEATVVEVTLSDTFQAGINWQVLGADPTGWDITQELLGANLQAPPFFSATYSEPGADAGEVTATVKALEQFGDVQVLSSPKIIALNNQTAILKVVDNRVYFTTTVDLTPGTGDTQPITTFETTVHTVPVGFVMNVTPFINEVEEVILNVRPTISRILGFVNDPNPDLASAEVESPIPEIQVREMESMLRVNSGQIAVIGGLMQDKIDQQTSAVPLLSSLPVIGNLFTYRNDQVVKTELIVFLRPRVLHVADVDGELRDYRHFLPSAESLDDGASEQQ